MTVVGVMGPFDTATEVELRIAHELGGLIAREKWVLLTGGRKLGVMDAASRGAKGNGGLTIGVIPTTHAGDVSSAVDLPIYTGMGSARNIINALSSQVLIACGMSAGTSAEISLAIRYRTPVVLVAQTELTQTYFETLGGELVRSVSTAAAAVEATRVFLKEQSARA